LFGYFNASVDHRSVTALIPAFIGVPLILCGLVAKQEKHRMHAMHAAVLIGLLGGLAAGGRAIMKLNEVVSDDPTIHRAPRFALLTGVVCFIYVAFCVRSFIAARRRRVAAEANKA